MQVKYIQVKYKEEVVYATNTLVYTGKVYTEFKYRLPVPRVGG